MKDASIYQRPGRTKYFISYYCPERMRRVHEATAWDVSDPTGIKHAIRFAAAKSAAAASFRGAAKHENWSVWAERYLEERYRNKPKTLTRYKNAWDWLRVFLEEYDLHVPQGVTYNHILRYVEWRTQKQRHCGKLITRNTALTEIKILGVLFTEAVRRGFTLVNPCIRLGMRRDPPAQKPEITSEEVAIIFALLAQKEGHLQLSDRWMTISFSIAIHHGCREAETQVPISSIDFANKTIRFVGKGNKVRTVGIHPGVFALLKELKASGAAVTCRLPVMAAKEWHNFFKSDVRLQHLCFHCTRVTVITRLARAGVPIQQAMAYVGHGSQAVHQIYQRLKADDLSLCTQAIAWGADKPC